MIPMADLQTDLNNEIARCEDLLKQYEAIGPAGMFGATLLRHNIADAKVAVAKGDLARMASCYLTLQDME